MAKKDRYPQERPSYPWDKWFASKYFTLRAGKDFTCMIHGMAQQVRSAAERRKMKASVRVFPDRIDVTVHKKLSDTKDSA